MTIEVQGQHAGDAVFVYNDEPARIPLRHVHVLSHNALVRDQGGCAYGGRWYDREALLRLRTDLDTGALAELDTCTEPGCEEAEHPDPTQARPRCARHLKDPR
jgi:hypothetical protein